MKVEEVRKLAQEFSDKIEADNFDENAMIDHFKRQGINMRAYSNKLEDLTIIVNFFRADNPLDEGWAVFRGSDMEVIDIMESVDQFSI